MQDQCLRSLRRQPLAAELIASHILTQIQIHACQPLLLDAQHHGDVCLCECAVEVANDLDASTEAERVFGKKNFLELYAVFSSPILYKVQIAESKRDLGSLEQAFVDRLVEEMSTFLLGGLAWMVVSVSHSERLVRVRSAPRGQKPSWGGFVPQFLGFEVCQAMKGILTSDDDYPVLDTKAKTALAEWRGEIGPLLRRAVDALQFDGTMVVWWTFAGGRTNQTLKYALEWKGDWKVVPDNFALKIQGDGVSIEAVHRVLAEMRSASFWEAAETRRHLRSLVPEYRLSKFQRVLPERWQVEMVGAYLLDFEGTARLLAERAGPSVGTTARR